MFKKLWFALLIVASPVFAQGSEPIKVGVLTPLTGFAAADGQSALAGIKLATKAINNRGGILDRQLELVTYDDQADPKQAVNFARRLMDQDDIDFAILASYSGATLAAADAFNRGKVPAMAAYAVAPKVTAGHPYIFRMGLLGPVQGRVGALLTEHLGANKAAILTIKNDFGQALEAGFRAEANKRGIEIVFHSSYPLGNKNFTATLTRIMASQPDVLYASGYYTEAASLVRQAQSLGFQGQIIGQEGYDSPKLIELAGSAANGLMITTTLDRDADSPRIQGFLDDYQERTGRAADMVGASGYAALTVMAKAADKAGGLDGPTIRKALDGMEDVDTIVGRVSHWNEDGDPIKTATVQTVKSGAFHRYMKVNDLDVLTP